MNSGSEATFPRPRGARLSATLSAVSIAGLLALPMLSSTLGGCSGDEAVVPSPAPGGSTVSIVGIVPTTDHPLHAGEHARLEMKIAYRLAVDEGVISAVAQDSNDQFIAVSKVAVHKGMGNEDMALEFKVPDTDRIIVFVPLSGEGQRATTTLATREYRVVRP